MKDSKVKTFAERLRKKQSEYKQRLYDAQRINHPVHYNKGIETTDYILSWDMNFVEGNIIKYVSRYKYKEGVHDLKKARWYLNKLISDIEKSQSKDCKKSQSEDHEKSQSNGWLIRV